MYRGQTEFYKIPYPVNGDKLSEQEELKRMNIIENQLLAATRGIRCCIFEDGEYHLVDNVDGTYTVMLAGYGSRDAVEGIINSGYVWSKEPILWTGLKKNDRKYLYLKFTDKLYQDETAFEILSSGMLYPKESQFHLLMAVFDYRGDSLTLETNPDNKIYSNDISVHIVDNKNPHGILQEQDKLDVKKELMFDGVSLISKDDYGITRGILKYDFQIIFDTTNGMNGKTFEIKEAKSILKVLVEERFIEKPEFKLGQIVVKYDGNKFVVYNNGEMNIDVKIFVLYEKI